MPLSLQFRHDSLVAAAGFPGMHTASSETKAKFTPASTIAYFVGFFVDGVVLAYDDQPVSCDLSLVKKMIMVIAITSD